MKSSKKLQISSHLLSVYINNQDRKWRMSVLVFSSALVYTIHKVLYTVHTVLYTVHTGLYTMHTTLYTMHTMLYTMHTMLYTIHTACCGRPTD